MEHDPADDDCPSRKIHPAPSVLFPERPEVILPASFRAESRHCARVPVSILGPILSLFQCFLKSRSQLALENLASLSGVDGTNYSGMSGASGEENILLHPEGRRRSET